MPNYDLITNKAEDALIGYITANLPLGLSGVQVSKLDDDTARVMPFVLVKAESAEERVFGHGIYDVNVSVTLNSQADDTTEAAHKQNAGHLFSELADFAAIKTALNKPSGTDSRTVTDFHVYNIRLSGTQHEMDGEEAVRMAVIAVQLICQGKDVAP